ncbi:MAG TPA: PRC and DUF2382 domain-containing protein [Actinoplanes sp.]
MITQNDIQQLFGADVYETDGSKIGSTGQVYLDDQTGNPEWVSVKTGLFGTKESFVPLEGGSLSGDRITVPFTKDQVKNAPRIDPDGDLTPAEEDELYTYYGLSSTGGRLSSNTYSETSTTTTDSTVGAYTGTETTTSGTATSGTATSGAGFVGDRETVGHDTSGPTTDDAMTRSEERIVAGTRREEAGRARLRKYVVTEQQQVSVPVSREEVRLEREPITDANIDRAMDGPAISEEEHEVTLRAERAVVDTEAVPVERVRLGKETVTEQQEVGGEVRKERIELDTDDRS